MHNGFTNKYDILETRTCAWGWEGFWVSLRQKSLLLDLPPEPPIVTPFAITHGDVNASTSLPTSLTMPDVKGSGLIRHPKKEKHL